MDKASVLKAIGASAKAKILDQHVNVFTNLMTMPHDEWMPAMPIPEVQSCGGKCLMEPVEFSFSNNMKVVVVFAGVDPKSLRAALLYVNLRGVTAHPGRRFGNVDVVGLCTTPCMKPRVYP